MTAAIGELPPPHPATDPTTAQPATPGDPLAEHILHHHGEPVAGCDWCPLPEAPDFRRERAILHWAADRLTNTVEPSDLAVSALRRWADELDAAPAAPLDIAARALLRELGWPEGDLLVQLDEAYEQAHQLGLAVWELTGSTEDDPGLESAGTVLQRAGVLLEAPAAPASPALPPEHQPGMDPDWCGYMAGKAAEALRQLGHTGLADHVEHLERAHAAGNPEHLYGLAGPLSTVPPAGTEGDR